MPAKVSSEARGCTSDENYRVKPFGRPNGCR